MLRISVGRLRPFIVALALAVLMLPAALYAQEPPSPIWRTLLTSDSTPQTGGTTVVFFQFGNRSAQPITVDRVICNTVAFNGFKTFSTNMLEAVQVVDGNGAPAAFFTSEFTSAAMPVNRTLLPWQKQTFQITLRANSPNYQYNLNGSIAGVSPFDFYCWVVDANSQPLAGDGLVIYVEPAF